MSSEADRKSAASDWLMVLLALLLVIATAAAVYFALKSPGKQFAHEPGARPRPIITNQVVVVNVQEVAPSGQPGAHGAHGAPAATSAPAPEAKPAEETKPAEKPAAPAAVVVNPPQVSPTTDGKIRGKVILKGTPPPESVIGAVKADANCGKVAVGTARTRSYVVGPDGGLRYALVRIVKSPAGAGKIPGPILIDQMGCMYEPYVSAVVVGETFKVQNSDPFMHNVNATPKINKGFNFAQAAKGQINEKTFDKPELAVKFACNVHPWMVAYLHVLENPFFAVTDDKGAFELPEGLPPGKYDLEVNHLKAGIVKLEVETAAGKGAEVVVEMAPAAK
jgi:plastocyanin